MARPWLKAEEDYLARKYNSMSIKEIAEFLDRSELAVQGRANVLNIKKRVTVADYHSDIVQLAQAEYTTTEIGKKLGFNTTSISKYCKENNIEVVKRNKKTLKEAGWYGFDNPEKINIKKATYVEWFKYWYHTYRKNGITKVTGQKYKLVYARIYKSPLGKVKLDQVKRSDVQEHMDWFGMDYSKNSVLDHAQFIRSSFKDAVIDGWIKVNPAENVNLTFKEQKLTPSQQKKLREKKQWLEVDEYLKLKYYLTFELEKMLVGEDVVCQTADQVYYMIIFIALKTGARFAEILGLTKNDFDVDDKIINIDKTWDYKCLDYPDGGFKKTKNISSIRIVPVDDQTIYLLKLYIKWLGDVETNKNTLFMFPGYKIYSSNVNHHLDHILKKLGIEYISLHKLRHTQASYLISQRVPLQVVAKRLGHSDTNMIQRVYGHLLKETEEEGNRMIRSLI